MNLSKEAILEEAKRVIDVELEAVHSYRSSIDSEFTEAVRCISGNTGRLIVCGMGKAGLIGQKIASTMSSLGIRASFLHPAEAVHGDLGLLAPEDVLLILSNSGETDEILKILPFVKGIGCKIISISSREGNTLARQSDIALLYGKQEEACALKMAPTTSTSLMLIIGDALAVCAMREKGDFDERKFAFFHPSGSLGKQQLKVRDVMKSGEALCVVPPAESLKSILMQLTEKRSGLAIISDPNDKLQGVFSDGDLRRLIKNEDLDLTKPIGELATQSSFFVYESQFCLEALKIMRDHRIGDMPVLNDKQKVVGVIGIKDLVEIGIY